VEDGGTNGLFQKYAETAYPGGLAYSQIKTLAQEGSGYTRYWDEAAQAPYLYNGDLFITYTDAEAIALIAAYAKEKGLSGVMVWEYAHDIDGELFRVLNDNFQK
jgi:chitinase